MRCLTLLPLALIALAFTVKTAPAQPQRPDTLWSRVYNPGRRSAGHCVQQTNDGGFIIAGNADVIGASDMLLIKTDAHGGIVWTQIFGGSYYDAGYCVEQTTDGGYIVSGYTGISSYQDKRFYLVKTYANGDTIWTRTLSGGVAFCVLQAQDGGYFATGYLRGPNLYFVKMDVNGNILWNSSLSAQIGYSAQQTLDGGYIVAGVTGSFGQGHLYVIKITNTGELQWQRDYYELPLFETRSVIQTRDGGYLIAGYSIGNDNGIYLIKTDDHGNVQWVTSNLGYRVEGVRCLQQTMDGGYIVTGYIEIPVYGIYVVKTNAAGVVLWSQNYLIDNCNKGYGIIQTPDGRYMITGSTGELQNSYTDVFLMKLENDMPVLLTLTPYHPPIRIPGNGGSFRYRLKLLSLYSSPLTFDGWASLILPNGNEYLLRIFPGLTITAGDSLIRDPYLNIPFYYPAGNYEFIVRAGVRPNQVWAEDRIPFQKSFLTEGLGDVGIEETAFATTLYEPNPNPFNSSTAISFELQAASEVRLSVYDIAGREVRSLVDGHLSSGYHEINFDGSELASGVYFVMLVAEGVNQVRKLLLVK